MESLKHQSPHLEAREDSPDESSQYNHTNRSSSSIYCQLNPDQSDIPAPFPVAASPAAVDGSAEGGVSELESEPEPEPAVGAEIEAVVLLE